jgi:pimeloyl-ACP methyl ester carboxylesterase
MMSGTEFLDRLDRAAARARTPTPFGTMTWRRWGEGPPIVLLHGASGSWRHWTRNIEPLSRTRSVWAADLPGMGDSDAPDEMPPRLDVARTVLDGIDVLLGAAAFDLAGFSYGGSIAAIAASLAPERVRSLMLIGTAGFGGNGHNPPTVRISGLTGAARAAAHRQNLASLMIATPANIDALALAIQQANTARRRLKFSGDRGTAFLPGVLERYSGPVSAVWGARDQFAQGRIEELIARLRAARPDVAIGLFADAGHWVPYEAADAFNDFLLARLDGATAPAGRAVARRNLSVPQ